MLDDGGNASASDPRTYFEDMSHRDMLRMLTGADHGKVGALADKLRDVATQVEQIGTDLRTHMAGVEWHGAAGDAFRDWGGKVAGATFTLSDYSRSAATQMSNVADVLGQVVQHDMPPIPQGAVNAAVTYRQTKDVYGPFGDAAEGQQATVCMPDPTPGQYSAALSTMEQDRVKAVDAMAKLGGAYQGAADVMSTQDEPKFPPPPDQVMPAKGDPKDGSSYLPLPPGSGGERVSVPTAGGTRPPGEPHETVTVGDPGRGRTKLLDLTGDPTGRPVPPPSEVVIGGATHRAGDPLPLPLPLEPGGEPPGVSTGGRPRTGLSLPDDEGIAGGLPGGTLRRADGIQGGRLVESPPPSGAGRFPRGTVIGEEPLTAAPRAAGRYGGSTAPGWERDGQEFTRGGSGLGTAREAAPGESRSGLSTPGGGAGAPAGRERAGHRPDYLTEEEETWAPGGHEVVPSVLE